jgi:hypothetical protein
VKCPTELDFITNITASDRGNYSCNVSNRAGFGASTSVLVVGLVFSTVPSRTSVDVNGSITLNCTVTGSEPITYQWFKDGSEVHGETGDMLILNPVQFGHFGGYHCVVNNSVNLIESREAIVTVSPNNSVEVTPRIILAKQRTNVTFTCVADGGPGNSFQWFHNEQMLEGERNQTMSLTGIGKPNEGDYTCLVTNEAGFGSATSVLTVGIEFVEEPMNMTVQSGDIVTLNCSITGSEPITYTWYKDGVRLEARRSSMLVFHPISSFDSGVYRCTALNAVNGLASRVFTVSVAVSRFPPESVNAPSLLGGVLGGVTAVVMGGFLVIAVFICYKVSAGP